MHVCIDVVCVVPSHFVSIALLASFFGNACVSCIDADEPCCGFTSCARVAEPPSRPVSPATVLVSSWLQKLHAPMRSCALGGWRAGQPRSFEAQRQAADSGSSEEDLLMHVAWYPLRSLTPGVLAAAVDCWRWILADLPRCRSRLMSEARVGVVPSSRLFASWNSELDCSSYRLSVYTAPLRLKFKTT